MKDYATQEELKKEFLKYKEPPKPEFDFTEFLLIAAIGVMGYIGIVILFSL